MDPCSSPYITHYSSCHVLFHESGLEDLPGTGSSRTSKPVNPLPLTLNQGPGDITPIMENEMETSMDDEKEAGMIQGY